MYLAKKMKNNQVKINNLDLDRSELKIIENWCTLNNVSIERIYRNKWYLNKFRDWNSKRINAFTDCHLYEEYMDSHIHMITELGYYDY